MSFSPVFCFDVQICAKTNYVLFKLWRLKAMGSDPIIMSQVVDVWQSPEFSRLARTRLRNSVVNRPMFTKFLSDVEGSSALLKVTSVLRSSHPCRMTVHAQNKSGICQFSPINARIGCHSNVSSMNGPV